MLVNSQHFRTIWPDPRCRFVQIIDQTQLPFQFVILQIDSFAMMVSAIKTMQVRGAPLIGVAAGYGMALAMREDDSDVHLQLAAKQLIASRPTAVNLAWAVRRMVAGLQGVSERRNLAAWRLAAEIAEEDVAQNRAIGQHGLGLMQAMQHRLARTINVLTHCNAGWLATVDCGTALAPIYTAHDAGIAVHVWVGETRPRNQGASLTAWELAQHGVPHTVITDNAGGHLMQKGQVDMVIVGADRVTAAGDVCNKIGTYLKALAAFDNNTPFYVAVPSPTIDWTIQNGKQIEIEERSAHEVAYLSGQLANGEIAEVNILPPNTPVANPAFDVTPARLVTAIITEHGVFAPQNLHECNSMPVDRMDIGFQGIDLEDNE
ncbi:MAG: S-methyl-5-thioribose-1-phosphate isomerase [Methylophilaceae bacterium]